jgi:hypothetical protein
MSVEDFIKEPYKKQTYDAYVLWKSLPSFLKGQPKTNLEKFGINEDIVFDLLSIKNQAEFSKEYKIDVGTLTDWNKRLEKDGLTKDINSWARKLTPNVIFALYKNITKHGRAHEVKAWYELIENN